jgi:hypothetical protein
VNPVLKMARRDWKGVAAGQAGQRRAAFQAEPEALT